MITDPVMAHSFPHPQHRPAGAPGPVAEGPVLAGGPPASPGCHGRLRGPPLAAPLRGASQGRGAV